MELHGTVTSTDSNYVNSWQNAVNSLDANGNLLLQCQIYKKEELNLKLLFSHHVNSLSPAASNAVLTDGATYLPLS